MFFARDRLILFQNVWHFHLQVDAVMESTLEKSPANEVQRIRSIGKWTKKQVVLSADRMAGFSDTWECGWILVHASHVKMEGIGYV